MTEPNNLESGADPRYKNIDYKAQEADLQLVRDVEEGETRIKAARHTYLPQEPAESAEAYEIRLNRSGWWDGTSKCKAALVGMVFRKPPVIGEGLAPEIEAIEDNIDLQGNDLKVVAKRAFDQALLDGHSFLFVDMARPLDPQVATKADEVGRRPYLHIVTKDQVWNWIEGKNAKGEIVATQATIYECVKEQVGRFAEKEVEQWRVLYLEAGFLHWQVWRVRETEGGGEETYVHDFGSTSTVDFIPLVPIYTRRTGFWKSKPALLGLARLNILHYQGWSDQKNILHRCRVPLIIFFGRDAENAGVEIGPNAALDMGERPACDAIYLEPAGVAVESGRQEQLDTERLMGVMGLELLAPRSDVEVTATQSAIDDSSQISELGGMVEGLDDAMNQVLWMIAVFLTLKDAGRNADDSKLFAANKDFQRLKLDSAMLTAFSNIVLSSQLPVEQLWWVMGRAELLEPGFNPEKAKMLIGEQALNLAPQPAVKDPALAA